MPAEVRNPASHWVRFGTTLSPKIAGDNITTTGTGTLGYLKVNQVNDTDGILVTGFDDRDDKTGLFHINSSGTFELVSNGNMLFRVLTGAQTVNFRGGSIYFADPTGANVGLSMNGAEEIGIPILLRVGDLARPTNLIDVKGKGGLTAIGGHAIKLTNKTGSNTVAGQLIIASTGTDDAFATAAANAENVIGIVESAGVADGSEAWIVISGIADVLIDAGGSTRGDRMIASATAGSADVWNVGGAVATHFLEIGHCIETRVGAGLARCVVHFN